jgi:hypothetical protein
MGLIETAKDAAKLVQQIGNIELYEKLVAIQQDAMSILDENWKLKEQVGFLKQELEKQQRFLTIDADLEYVEDGGFYIRNSDKEAGRNIPYCPLCWRVDKALVPLNPMSGRGSYQCSVHKTHHETAAYREDQRRVLENSERQTNAMSTASENLPIDE